MSSIMAWSMNMEELGKAAEGADDEAAEGTAAPT